MITRNKISLSLDDEILEIIDAGAKSLSITRSAYIRRAVLMNLKHIMITNNYNYNGIDRRKKPDKTTRKKTINQTEKAGQPIVDKNADKAENP